jgi:hypothetical protein
MNLLLRVNLTPTPEQHVRLLALQVAFAEVCNALAPMVQQTRVWNRVALHHMAYKTLRERFPAVGSQMVCNAIYSVSRTCRLLFQSTGSPLNVSRNPGRPLPLIRFTDASPVYFDRHTLSLKQGEVSMFTLDGRMRFRAGLSDEGELAFHQRKLLEIVLSRNRDEFELRFVFAPIELVGEERALGSRPQSQDASKSSEEPEMSPRGFKDVSSLIPDYLRLEEAA